MVAPVTKLLMPFGTPCARKDLSWCRVLVLQTPFRCHCSGLTGPSSFSIALLVREVQQAIATLLPSADRSSSKLRDRFWRRTGCLPRRVGAREGFVSPRHLDPIPLLTRKTRFTHHRIDRGIYLHCLLVRLHPILFDCLYTKWVNPSK